MGIEIEDRRGQERELLRELLAKIQTTTAVVVSEFSEPIEGPAVRERHRCRRQHAYCGGLAAWMGAFSRVTAQPAIITLPLGAQVTPANPLSHALGEEYLTFQPGPGPRILWTIAADGRVTLSPDLNLDDVKGMPLEQLRALREIVNTAIYDKERGI